MLSKPFDVYLNDHLALLVAERELCQRVQRSNEGSALAEVAGRQLGSARAGEAMVRQLLDDRGAAVSTTKATAAWLAEKAGRLKLNGRIIGYSPGSRVLELEGLILATQTRAMLWQTLAGCRTRIAEPSSRDWTGLQEEAEAMLAELRSLHRSVVAAAFGPEAGANDAPGGIHR